MFYEFEKEEDGYYYDGAWGSDPKTDIAIYMVEEPIQANMKFMDALYKGIIQPSQLVQSEFASNIMSIAEERKITRMKWGYDYDPDPKRPGAVRVSFKSPTGEGTDVFEFVYRKNKDGLEQFDASVSGTLLDNMTPMKVATSYINALIDKDNAYSLKNSVFRPKGRILKVKKY